MTQLGPSAYSRSQPSRRVEGAGPGADARQRRIQRSGGTARAIHPQPLAYEAETVAPVYKRTDAIERRIAEMIATTPAGLAAQVRITMERFGYDNGGGMEQVEGRLLRNMLTGAEGMANA